MVDSQDAHFWEFIADSTLFLMFLGQTPMHMQRQQSLISIIDKHLGIPCFPNWQMTWHFDDKVAQQYILESAGLPVVKAHVFWDKEKALKWASDTDYPQVFKLKGGAGSLNVVKVNKPQHTQQLIKKMFGKGITNGRVPGVGLLSVFKGNYTTLLKSYLKGFLYSIGARSSVVENWSRHQGYAYFQDFLPGNSYDTRVTVIGDRAFGFIRYNRHNDFRSSGSGSIDFTPGKVDLRMVKDAFTISRELSFSTMAYDFLLDVNGFPVVTEMCCQFADWAVYQCSGFWDAELNWHDGHFWPQYTQLQYLLGIEDFGQPDFPVNKGSANLIRY